MRSILVTGGAGFIGSHTCVSLLEKGYHLIVIDSFVNSSLIVIDRIDKLLLNTGIRFEDRFILYKGDVRDNRLLNTIFEDSFSTNRPIQAVIHFAGLKSVSESVAKPALYWDANLIGSISLLNVMEKYNCRTLIFSSSATIYGSIDKSPIFEDSGIRPINPYGTTKAAIESFLHDIYNSKSLQWRIANLRYFNPVGAHPSGLIGEDPSDRPSNLFPYICQVAIGRRKSLKIYGNNWPTADGTGVRDYIHVMDLADAHIATLEYLLEGEPQIINLNIGTGIGTSVLEMVQTFEKVNSCKIPYIFTQRRAGDVAISFASNKLALSTLKWITKKTLDDICRDGWNWQRLNPYGYSK